MKVEDHNVEYGDRKTLQKGVPYARFPDGTWISVSGKGSNLVSNPHGLYIVSKKLGELLFELSNGDIQLIDAPLVDEAGRHVPGFAVINCLRVIECLDWENSVYRKDEKFGTLVVIEERIDGSKIPEDVDIFRIGECPSTGLYVRRRVYEAMTGKGLGLSDVNLVGIGDQRFATQELECLALLAKYKASGSHEERLKYAEAGVAMHQVSPKTRAGVRCALLQTLAQMGQYQASLRVCEEILADPQLAQHAGHIADRCAARNEHSLGRIKPAIARLKRICESRPDDEEAKRLYQLYTSEDA